MKVNWTSRHIKMDYYVHSSLSGCGPFISLLLAADAVQIVPPRRQDAPRSRGMREDKDQEAQSRRKEGRMSGKSEVRQEMKEKKSWRWRKKVRRRKDGGNVSSAGQEEMDEGGRRQNGTKKETEGKMIATGR